MRPEDTMICETMESLHQQMVAQDYSPDPRKWREVVGALQTGCVPLTTKTGPDCLNESLPIGQRGCERKSSTGKRPSGTYSGLSCKDTWEEQKEYLIAKIRNCGRHYFDRFHPVTGQMVESWWMTGEQAYELLLPKIKKDFLRKKKLAKEGKINADPRLSGTICWTEIKDFGTQEI